MSRPRTVHRTNDAVEQVENALPEMYHHREDARSSDEQAKNLVAMLLGLYKRLNIKTYTVDVPGGRITGTHSESYNHVLDEEKLKARIGAQVFKKIIRPVVDKKLLDDAIRKGLISPLDVEACTTHSLSSETIRTSFNAKRKGNGDDDE